MSGRRGVAPLAPVTLTLTRPAEVERTQRPTRRARVATWVAHLVLAGVAYVPLLLTAPGEVGADDKLYLYLHPASFMAQVASMWDPSVDMGTVTHQYIGYLFPMGPYYALMQWLVRADVGGPALWTGSILFAAGAGVLFLLRTLSRPGDGPARGSLDMAHRGGHRRRWSPRWPTCCRPTCCRTRPGSRRSSCPGSGLPWMLGLVARALDAGGWRHAALLRPGGGVVGSTNATS